MPELSPIGPTMPWHAPIHRPSSSFRRMNEAAAQDMAALGTAPAFDSGSDGISPALHARARTAVHDALPTEAVGLAAWDLAASGLMWIHTIPPRSSEASQGAGSTFTRHLGRRTNPQVQSNGTQLL
jgi:hypothetical protein